MYNIDDLQNALEKFKKFIEEDRQAKIKSLDELGKKLEVSTFVDKFNEYFSVEFIINNKDRIIQLMPDLCNEVKIVDFFYRNNALNIEQVTIALKKIRQSSILDQNNNLGDLSVTKIKLENRIAIYTSILDNEVCELDDYIEIIESSPLNESEKLLVYTDLTHKTIHKEETKEEEEEIISYDICNKEYSLLQEKTQEYINKYYYLISDKEKSYINYIKGYVNITKLEDDDLKYDYPEERLIIKIVELIDMKDEIERNLKNLTDESETSELEDLKLNIEILKEQLDIIEKYILAYETYKTQQRNNDNPSKVYFLMDENGNLFFDINSFDSEQKQKIIGLIDKLNRGIYDYQKGIKHSKIQTDNKNIPVFMNRNSDMGCSFIRLDNDKVLILDFGLLKTIFDSTNKILNQNSDLIKSAKNKILNSDSDELEKQEMIISELDVKLKNGGNPKL